jgi:hypothetical protein
LLIDCTAQVDKGVETFPGHALRPRQHRVDSEELRTMPMLFQDTPAAFNGMVFAVVRGKIQ